MLLFTLHTFAIDEAGRCHPAVRRQRNTYFLYAKLRRCTGYTWQSGTNLGKPQGIAGNPQRISRSMGLLYEPFPEQSLSIVSRSTGKAWFEATLSVGPGLPISYDQGAGKVQQNGDRNFSLTGAPNHPSTPRKPWAIEKEEREREREREEEEEKECNVLSLQHP